MSERFDSDQMLDELIGEALPELPPDDIAREVTPWRKSMGRVLTGMVLVTVQFNFLLLQYILPAAGVILMLLGYRQLRRENKWFRLGYVLSWITMLRTFASLIINTTIYSEKLTGAVIGADALRDPLVLASLTVSVLSYAAFYKGFRAVQDKAGAEDHSALTLLMVWYAALLGLSLIGFQGGLVIGIIIVALYAVVIKGVIALTDELDAAGYCIRPAPVRIADSHLTIALLAVLAAGMICGGVFFSRYPMQWEPAGGAAQTNAADAASQAQTEEIRARLVDLGLPEALAADLDDETLLAMDDASEVITVKEHGVPLEAQPQTTAKTSWGSSYTYTTWGPPIPAVSCANYAVRRGDGENWMLIYSFRWPDEKALYGTAMMRTDISEWMWTLTGTYGRVLYDKAGESYSAPMYSINTDPPVFTQQWRTSAEFSLPRKAAGRRGYMAFEIEPSAYLLNALKEEPDENSGLDYRYVIDSYCTYRFQTGALVYPMRKASAEGGWWAMEVEEGGFFTFQDELQAKIQKE